MEFFSLFLIIWLTIDYNDAGQFCVGGFDPICYFPEPSQDYSTYKHPKRYSVRYHHKKTTTVNVKENEIEGSGPNSKREKRIEKEEEQNEQTTKEQQAPAEHEKTPGDEQNEAPCEPGTKCQETEDDDDDSTEDDNDDEDQLEEDDIGPEEDISQSKPKSGSNKTSITNTTPKPESEEDEFDPLTPITPLTEGEITQPQLRVYPSTEVRTRVYPPFTYRGFYSPAEWDTIPNWYFLPVAEKKIGKYTKMLLNDKSGVSFMDFSAIYQKQVEKQQKGKEDDANEEFGVSSKNCTNSYFPAPLDIITENAAEDNTIVEFNFNNFDVFYSFIMFLPEDGTDLLFVKVQTPPKQIRSKPSIEKGATLGNTLYLDRVMIHYGTKPTEGSEHRINGKAFGMELQFFFNTQDRSGETPYWRTLENYIVDNDQTQYGKNLLVLCILVQVGPHGEKKPPPGKDYNKGMRYLATAAEMFWGVNNQEKFRAYAMRKKILQMNDFFKEPATSGLYYTYYGSLTHPPCLNNTRYAVFEKSLYMSHEDWLKFLFIPSMFSDTGFVAGNWRPMDIMTFTSNKTNVVTKYDAKGKLRLSYTVRKSRRSTQEERMAEYDYYEDLDNSTTLSPKGNPPKR